MRVVAVLTICLMSSAAYCADAPLATEQGSWRLVVLDGGRIRDVARRETPAAPVSFTRSHNDVRSTAAWSLQLGSVRPSTHLHSVAFGPSGGVPVAGDFNGDGFAELGLFVDGRWYLDLNADNTWNDGDLLLSLGHAGDVPLTGDWNQDGKTDLGIYTPGEGDEHALAVVGDWAGTGNDCIGLFRDGVWRLDTDGDGRLTSTDLTLQLGQAGDRPLVGDFNRDGRDDLGVYRNGRWLIDTTGDHRFGADDLSYTYGMAADLPIVGDWDGDGRDQIGLLHR
jgi:hypothetical protein